jgi:hypothetical protein
MKPKTIKYKNSLTQLEEIWKTTQIFLKMEDDLNFFVKEDDLNFLENVRRPKKK